MVAPLMTSARVALVHDWLNQYGGAERVLEVLKTLFPAAPVYTSMYWPDALPDLYRTWDIRTSFLDGWPMVKRHHQPFLPVYPVAFASLNLAGHDLILSNKSAFCHGVHKPSGARHLCYCLTPTRFVWDFGGYVAHEGRGRLAQTLVPPLLGWLRAWDKRAADGVDQFAAISTAVQQRIRRYYGHPPTDVARFAGCNEDRRGQWGQTPVSAPTGEWATTGGQRAATEGRPYYLVVSRLIPYKRVDLAIQAFNRLGQRLVMIGDGRDRARLEGLAGPTIEFWGRLSDEDTRHAMARCQALIFPGLEDFGLTPVEAQASGRPVVAYAAGGALDTVIPGLTGALFYPQTADALAETVARLDPRAFDPALCRQNAMRFDISVFRRKLAAFVGVTP
jgi:glycosyltransferase involved in cell wall biosynthesis